MEKIIIEKTGVVYFSEGYETSFKVDRFNLLAELAEQLEASNHSADFDAYGGICFDPCKTDSRSLPKGSCL